MKKSDENLIDPAQRLRSAPRCSAKAKSTGRRCQCPSKHGWNVCRLHGAGGGHPAGPKHPSWRHGMRSREWTDERRMLNEIVQEYRMLENAL